jgi:DNA polymerase I-like protein with 3'-5' exonuclease and polymerase domains
MHDGAAALAAVERNGIRVDVEYCRERVEWLGRKIEQAETRFRRTRLYDAWQRRYEGKLNLTSNAQLRSVLYADLKVRAFRQTEKGDDSADEESLRQTGIEGIEYLIRSRKYRKIRDFVKGILTYQIDEWLYPYFHLHTVQTYRSSSSEINFQNLPKRDKEAMDICRRAIIPSDGNQLLEIDFSGIEVGISACHHKDPTMLRYLRDPKSDMHTDMAKELFFLQGLNSSLKEVDGGPALRQASKGGFVFPEFYGDWYESCAFDLAVNYTKLPHTRDWTADDGIVFRGAPIGRHMLANKIEALSDYVEHVKGVERDFWNRRFPVYKRWREEWHADYQRTGSFEMKTGFRCGGVMARNQVVNYPVQGSAFHCLLRTLILVVNRTRGWLSKVVGEIHDSVLFDARPSEVPALIGMVEKIAADLHKYWDWIIVPMRVEASLSEVNGHWADMADPTKRVVAA